MTMERIRKLSAYVLLTFLALSLLIQMQIYPSNVIYWTITIPCLLGADWITEKLDGKFPR